MTKLSVIIPVYNESKTVIELLRRVQAVDLPGIEKEVIIIDDGSTDDSRELLKSHADGHVLCLHPSNRGKGAALRTGYRGTPATHRVGAENPESGHRDARVRVCLITHALAARTGLKAVHMLTYPSDVDTVYSLPKG